LALAGGLRRIAGAAAGGRGFLPLAAGAPKTAMSPIIKAQTLPCRHPASRTATALPDFIIRRRTLRMPVPGI
jgi:hypothetical protein